jgi:peptidoglycan/xylan/chitin deacetylase (PgdA/CDA1 family)
MRPPIWLLLALLLSLPLGGCARTIVAMPASAVPPSPTPAPTVTPAEVKSDDSGPALPSLRSIFLGRTADDAAGSVSPRLTYLAALRSPLATPPLLPPQQEAVDIWDILPTPTPTPTSLDSQAPALPVAVPVSDTIAVTELLNLTVPGAAGAPETNSPGSVDAPLLVPTPTPQKPIPAAFALAPDGVSRSAQIPILMYHYLSVPPPGADIYRQDLSVTPDLFAAHLDAMRTAGYTAISLYDLLAHLTQGAPLPQQPVIITFDDGYRDNYENAFPLLRQRNMVATFFVVTDFIDEQRPEYLTWDMVREMLAGGMSMESHGRNHVSLKNKDVDYLIWQALGSMETIEYELGTRPRFVSYPAGQYDQATADVFASAGYWAGLTTVQGATHSSDSLFDLRRVRVRGTTTPDELLRLLDLDW